MKFRKFFKIQSFNNFKYDKFKVDKDLIKKYNEDVLTIEKIKEYISEEAYKNLISAKNKKSRLDRKYASEIAEAIKNWAIKKEVKHYTHWFQPLTKTSAEKHDSFFDFSDDGDAIQKLSGNSLIQQEPDASSFPNGGIRNTFEARGYTAWDITSNPFIINDTLCIPTIFISYTGESLDYKMPLLKSISRINETSTNIINKLFDKDVKNVVSTLGVEQEFFLIDYSLYESRPDLVLTGRTLLGNKVAKGQQLDDHYFGSIPDRVINYLNELEEKCIRVGIPLKTRHNEVAPCQFEIAPIFEEANISVDHNVLLMDIMQKLALKHNFKVLFHEKPFEGINGSGKHNNWSLITNKGDNLLSPSSSPKNNFQFLVFFINIIKAVKDNADLLRAIVSSCSNDYRLGANEAPPAIISIFIGKYLTNILSKIKNLSDEDIEDYNDFKLDILDGIPEILLDNTDRNRTSPFAFTGNKFEFRAVGSSDNCSMAVTTLNTILSNQLEQFDKDIDKLENKKDIMPILRQYIIDSENILFEGNGYSEQWIKEAAKRKLNNFKNTPEALSVLERKDIIYLFEKNNILSKSELKARYDIFLEDYIMKLQIESRVLGGYIRKSYNTHSHKISKYTYRKYNGIK